MYAASWSSPLNPRHQTEWLASGVDRAIIDRCVVSLEDRWEINRFLNWHTDSRTAAGRKGHSSGWVCRGLDPLLNWEPMGWGCFKPDTPRANQEGKSLKYEHPKGEPTRAFFLDAPNFSWKAIQADVTVPIVLCEGAKKAGSLLSQGFAAVALPGVYSGYRKTKEASGKSQINLIPDLEILAQPGRVFYFCFDHDTKPKTIRNVNLAIARTGKLLAQQGCTVRVLQLPGPEKGVDDFIVTKGVALFEELYDQALSLAEWQAQAFNDLTYEPQIRLNQRFLGELVMVPEQGLIGICSAKGTGKTESLKTICRKVRRVLLIGHRTNLLRNLADRLELSYYADEGVVIEKASKLAITFDSLYKLPTSIQTAEGARAVTYDLIVVDEVEQGLFHAAHSTTCKQTREKVLAALEFFTKNALQVVVADADLSDVSIDYLAALRGGQEQPFLIVNDYRNGGRNIHWYPDKDEAALVATLMTDITDGGVPYIFTDSKDRAKTLAEALGIQFPTKKIKLIHGDNSGEAENIDFIENINDCVSNWDIVISTPSLGTGVSIDVLHFTSVWGVFAGGSLAAQDCSQGLFRVRAELPLHVWVNPQVVGGYRTTHPKVLREQALEKNRATGILLQIDPLTGVWGAANEPYLQLWSALSARRNASLNDLRTSLAALLETEGHTLIPVLPSQDLATEVYRELLVQTRQILRFRSAQSVADALELTEAEVEILDARAERLSESERHQLEKRRIRQGYGLEVTPELVLADDRGRLYKSLCALDDLLSPGEVAHDHDRKDREWHTVVTDHSHHTFKRQARLYLRLEQYLDPTVEFSETDLEDLGDRARAKRLSIKGILNLTIPEKSSNTWILGQLLHQLGLKTVSRKVGSRGAVQRLYRITQESWDFAEHFLAYRQQRRASRKDSSVDTPDLNYKKEAEQAGIPMGNQPFLTISKKEDPPIESLPLENLRPSSAPRLSLAPIQDLGMPSQNNESSFSPQIRLAQQTWVDWESTHSVIEQESEKNDDP